MMIEVFVFSSQEGLFDVRWEGINIDESTVFFEINFVEQITVAIENLGGELRWIFDKILRMGEFVKNLEVSKSRNRKKYKEKNEVMGFDRGYFRERETGELEFG